MKAYQLDEFVAEYAFLVSEEVQPLFECQICLHVVEVTPSLTTEMKAYQQYMLPCFNCGHFDKLLTHEYA